MIGFHDVPPEIRRLAMDVKDGIETARTHLDNHNYGLAVDWLEDTLKLLPVDTGEQIIWAELERRTSS